LLFQRLNVVWNSRRFGDAREIGFFFEGCSSSEERERQQRHCGQPAAAAYAQFSVKIKKLTQEVALATRNFSR